MGGGTRQYIWIISLILVSGIGHTISRYAGLLKRAAQDSNRHKLCNAGVT